MNDVPGFRGDCFNPGYKDYAKNLIFQLTAWDKPGGEGVNYLQTNIPLFLLNSPIPLIPHDFLLKIYLYLIYLKSRVTGESE